MSKKYVLEEKKGDALLLFLKTEKGTLCLEEVQEGDTILCSKCSSVVSVSKNTGDEHLRLDDHSVGNHQCPLSGKVIHRDLQRQSFIIILDDGNI